MIPCFTFGVHDTGDDLLCEKYIYLYTNAIIVLVRPISPKRRKIILEPW